MEDRVKEREKDHLRLTPGRILKLVLALELGKFGKERKRERGRGGEKREKVAINK